MLLGKLLTFLGGDRTAMCEVTLVANEHDGHVWVCVLAGVFEPAGEVVERLTSGDVVNEEGTHRTSVIRRSDRTISLLPGSVPNLCLDGLPIMRADFLGGELYADCGLRFEVEVTLGVSEEQVRFADPRVTDHYDLEKVVIGLILSSFHIMN